MASNTTKEATMTDFTVAEDFPKSEIEFDQRFRDIDACYNYLASIKWPAGSYAKHAGTRPIGSVPNTSTFARDVNINIP
jgi:hypothetical protein